MRFPKYIVNCQQMSSRGIGSTPTHAGTTLFDMSVGLGCYLGQFYHKNCSMTGYRQLERSAFPHS